jgi:hypothetical protein
MARVKYTFLVGDVLFLLLLGGCQSKSTPVHPVSIVLFKVDATHCNVSPGTPVTLSIQAHDVAAWSSRDQKYTVFFNLGSPFKRSDGGTITSFPVIPGQVTQSPEPSFTGTFEYIILDPMSAQCKDPGLIVKP